jgi:DNA gyrase subunit A
MPARRKRSSRTASPSPKSSPKGRSAGSSKGALKSQVPSPSMEIEDVSVSAELRSSFLSYALSVIVARALPDARDGLKPVHRRILFSLHSQRILPSGPFKKSARIVGDTMAKYHPHGDSAIYESLVRMAQDFSMRLPLVDPHGNFGSLDDSPAASRYTECRLSEAGLLLLAGLDEDAVSFVSNYDGTESEPACLPADFPNLLVNGSTGVAVGMATNIPPHNLDEIITATIMVLQKRTTKLDDLLQNVHGPDFPTGGEMVSRSDLRDLYATGRGSINVRAKVRIVDLPSRRKGIEVVELPYMVGPEKVVSRIRDLVSDKRLPAVADVKDFSDRSGGLRLLIEVKSGFDPLVLLADLYRLTPMEESFAASFVALVDGRPKVCSLLDLLHSYADHKLDTLRRRSEFQLRRAKDRAHLQEALVLALDNIDSVVKIIRSASDTAAAREGLMRKLRIDAVQADYVLEMPLRRLTTLEVDKVRKDLAALRKEIDRLETLLASPKRLIAAAVSSLESVRARFATPRRTALAPSLNVSGLVQDSPPAPNSPTASGEPVLVACSKSGWLGRVVPGQGRARLSAHDVFTSTLLAPPSQELFAVFSSGLARIFSANDLPEVPRSGKGLPPSELFSGVDGKDNVIAIVPSRSALLLVSENGVVKRLAADAYPAQLRSECSLISLAEGDRLVSAAVVLETDEAVDVFYVSSDGQVLCHPISQVRSQQRAASGMQGIKLAPGARVISAGAAVQGSQLWVATDSGGVKGTSLDDFPRKGRSTGGVLALRWRSGETSLVAAALGPTQALTANSLAAGPMPGLVSRTATAQILENPTSFFATPRP